MTERTICRPSSPAWEFTEEEQGDGSIRLGISIGPDHSQHPGLPAVLDGWLQSAMAMGFRFMRAPRIGMPRPPVPEADYFPRPNDASYDRFSALLAEIETRGVGHSAIRDIGKRFNQRLGSPDSPWFRFLSDYRNPHKRTDVAKAVAEWADGDTVAAHYAFSNDVLCTEDAAQSAGRSVFDAANRAWLTQQFGITFASVEALASIIANP